MVKNLLVAGLTAAVACVTVAAPASAAADRTSAAQSGQLRNAETGLCLAIDNGDARAGKKVIQWTCNGMKDQRWIYSRHRLVNAKTGMCLAIGGGEARKGAHVIQWPCTDGGMEQEWVRDDLQRLWNRATGLCLAIGNGDARAGVKAIQWTCNDVADQAWHMQRQ